MIVVMDHGEVVECGAPQQLLANSKGEFAQLYAASKGAVAARGGLDHVQ
jgi:ABC-type multidrug transport system fused ATPase/permease subunit